MNRLLFAFFLSLSTFAAFSQIPNGYYDDAQGLSGEELKTALYNIIKGHNEQSYASIWIHFESTDPKSNGKVWDMYSDVPGGNPPYEYNFGDDQCGNYSGEGDCYNREHSFPKSWFNDATPMYTDLFQIVPTDGYVNGMRSNYPYGEVSNPSWTSQNGSKLGNNSTSGYSGVVFEPIDGYKGDFARIYFYMATRYENLIAGWENNTTESDAALNGTSFPCYEEWYLNLLLSWNAQDPVSQKEIDRNNAIYNIQNNRNPYVDHPEYVNMVWGGSEAPVIANISWNPTIPDENEAVTVSATITDDGTISTAVIQWGLSSGNLNQTAGMTYSGSSYSGTIPGQAAGVQVYFKISATDNENNNTQSSIYNYQVNAGVNTIALPFLEDFEDQDLGIFSQYSVTGPDQVWVNSSYSNNYFAKMSNYNGSTNLANEDWLITPAINFNAYSNEVMQFQSAMMDYSDLNTHIYVKYSTNYSGSGNPNSASWTDLTSQANWSVGNFEWTASGEIDLSGINGTQVFIAFIYDSEAGSGKTWEIDDVSITLNGITNLPPVISNITHTPLIPAAGEAVTIAATITDDVSVESAVVLWGFSSGSLGNIVNMTHSGSNYSGQIPGQDGGTTVFFKIQAFDNEGAMTESSVYSYTVESSIVMQTLPFIETFETEDLGIFNSYSVSGDNEWYNDVYDDNHFAKMSNYNGSENLENQDWLITNAINFNNYSNEVMNFRSAMMNYSDNTTFMYLKYSINYDGSSNPNTASWVDLTSQANWSSGNFEWVESGDIDLSGITGTAVYLAFVYDSQDGSGKTWEIDNVSVTLEGANEAPVISNVGHSPSNPTNYNQVIVSATITDDVDVSVAQIQWGTSPVQLSNVVTMNASGSNYSGIIPAQNAGIYVYYRIFAEDNESAQTYSSVHSYYVDLAEGLSPVNQKAAILVYPNPAKNDLMIETHQELEGELFIFNSSGQLILQVSQHEELIRVDVSDFPRGVYLIQFVTKDGILNSKFMVE